MGASDRARTETRAFLIVASADWSTAAGLEGFNLGILLEFQPCDSDSGLSSRPTLLPSRTTSFLLTFLGDPEMVLSSDEE